MSDKIIRRYPIRKTRKKWNIKLYSRHICSEFCDIKILRDARIPTQLFIMNNPFYKNGKCEKYNIISDTFIRLAYFNSENNHIDDSNELYDPNIKVIPDSCFKLSVYYPLTYLFEIIISSNTQDGYSLKDIIGYIKTLYEFIYEEEERTATPQIYNLTKYCIECSNKDVETHIENIECQNSKEDCCICYNEYAKGEIIGKLKCGHLYHKDCVVKWFDSNGTCPMCRYNVFDCKNCDGSGIIHYRFVGTVIPIEERGVNTYRNMTNGIFGIYDCDLEDLIINGLSYDRTKKHLRMNIIS